MKEHGPGQVAAPVDDLDGVPVEVSAPEPVAALPPLPAPRREKREKRPRVGAAPNRWSSLEGEVVPQGGSPKNV